MSLHHVRHTIMILLISFHRMTFGRTLSTWTKQLSTLVGLLSGAFPLHANFTCGISGLYNYSIANCKLRL